MSFLIMKTLTHTKKIRKGYMYVYVLEQGWAKYLTKKNRGKNRLCPWMDRGGEMSEHDDDDVL